LQADTTAVPLLMLILDHAVDENAMSKLTKESMNGEFPILAKFGEDDAPQLDSDMVHLI
jgi:hypothetical protein